MKTCLLTLSALLVITTIKAQTADEIIAKHIDALGGKDLIAKMTSVYIESSTAVMGNDAPTKTSIVVGKDYKNETDFNGQNIVQVVNDKSGWMINPFAGASDATALSDDDFKSSADAIYVPDPLVNYAANGGKVELMGQEKVGDINAYKIKYTNKYASETVYYIDPATPKQWRKHLIAGINDWQKAFEKAGMKGLKIGDAQASLQHPNYLVNTGKATAVEVRELAKKIKEEVYQQFGIHLVEEAVTL